MARSRKRQKTDRVARAPFPATASAFNTTLDTENLETPEAGAEAETGAEAEADTEEFQEAEERIQITDLHTKNPIISYQNQIYSCNWTTAIGTDLLLTPPDSESPFPVATCEQGFNVLATTGIKLVGRPVQLVPRLDVRADKTKASSIQKSDDHLDTRFDNEGQPDSHTHIPVGREEGRAKHNQAKFLERLIAAKTAKGEIDMVTVHTRRTAGTGWRSRLQDADPAPLGDEKDRKRNRGSDEERQTSREATAPGGRASEQVRGRRIGRPRGRSSKRAIGGLFRDYRPTVGDTEGADIRGISNSTPRSWNELGQTAMLEQYEGNGEKGVPDVQQDDTIMEDIRPGQHAA